MIADHIGYAVKDIASARKVFEDLGYRFENLFEDTSRNLFIQFGESNGLRVELLAKLDKNKPSPVDTFLDRIGPTPYHICYITYDIQADILALRQKGFSVLLPPREAIAFNGEKVSFLYEKNIGTIELVEKGG